MKARALMRNVAVKQQGVVLVVALIVLVAMALAGIAMVRQISAGLGVAGNMAFKQGATAVGDYGLENALQTFITTKTDPSTIFLDADSPMKYFSSWDTSFNPFTYDWTASNASTTVTPDPPTGERIRFVIHRMCQQANVAVEAGTQNCVTSVSSNDVGGALRLAGDDYFGDKFQPYYRVTARVDGPRGTTSYVQMFFY
jgi:Tfp pilus assembly protein PilX